MVVRAGSTRRSAQLSSWASCSGERWDSRSHLWRAPGGLKVSSFYRRNPARDRLERALEQGERGGQELGIDRERRHDLRDLPLGSAGEQEDAAAQRLPGE